MLPASQRALQTDSDSSLINVQPPDHDNTSTPLPTCTTHPVASAFTSDGRGYYTVFTRRTTAEDTDDDVQLQQQSYNGEETVRLTTQLAPHTEFIIKRDMYDDQQYRVEQQETIEQLRRQQEKFQHLLDQVMAATADQPTTNTPPQPPAPTAAPSGPVSPPALQTTAVKTTPTANADDDNIEPHLKAVLKHLTTAFISDAVITPSKFNGNNQDIDKVEKWLTTFNRYAQLKSFDNLTKLQVFKLLLTDEAAEWLTSLNEQQTDTFEHLLEAFQARFAMTELHRLQKLSQWQRDQLSTETVDQFITSIKNAAKKIPITDPALIRLAIIRGLKPAIKLHVMQTGALTLDDVIAAARLAEEAITASGTSNDISNTQLLNKFEKVITDTINAIAVSTKQDPEPVSAMQPPSAQRQQQTTQRQQNNWTKPSRGSINQRTSYQPRYNQPSPGQQQFRPYRPNQEQRSNWRSPYQQQQMPYQQTSCGNCSTQHETGACPARDIQCYNCGRRGHFNNRCRSQPMQRSHYSQPTQRSYNSH